MPLALVACAVLFHPSGISAEPEPALADSIRIERKGCYGSCPVYRATLYSKGTIRYSGEAFVEHKGNYKGQITHWNMLRLDQLAKKLEFDLLDPSYRSGATDLETTIITITRGKSVKRVSCYGETPVEFYGLQVAIERVIQDSRDTWVPVG